MQTTLSSVMFRSSFDRDFRRIWMRCLGSLRIVSHDSWKWATETVLKPKKAFEICSTCDFVQKMHFFENVEKQTDGQIVRFDPSQTCQANAFEFQVVRIQSRCKKSVAILARTSAGFNCFTCFTCFTRYGHPETAISFRWHYWWMETYSRILAEHFRV